MARFPFYDILLLSGAVACVACTGLGENRGLEPARIKVSTKTGDVSVTLALGDTTTLIGDVVNRVGSSYPASVAWVSRNVSIVSTNDHGRIEALTPGTTFVVASAADLLMSDSVKVTVAAGAAASTGERPARKGP